MGRVVAKLIGEILAGMIAVEIYEDNQLVWSHDYTAKAITDLNRVYRQVVTDMLGCADWEQFEGCDLGDDGKVKDQDAYNTTGVIVEYENDNRCWYSGHDPTRYGLGVDIFYALKAAGGLEKEELNGDSYYPQSDLSKYIREAMGLKVE